MNSGFRRREFPEVGKDDSIFRVFRSGFIVTVASKGISALSKLVFVGILLAAFTAGMAGVVYMSLSGRELSVPEIVGKDFVESEKELAALGLKIKRRADRPSTEKVNTVLEQLPKAGETVKTGQMILVVVSKAGLAGDEVPSSLKKDLETDDDADKIEEMISDKPKKPRANSNSKKKVDTTRDVIANNSKANTADGTGSVGTNKADTGAGAADKNNRNTSTAPMPNTTKPPVPDKLPPARSGAPDSRQRPPAKP